MSRDNILPANHWAWGERFLSPYVLEEYGLPGPGPDFVTFCDAKIGLANLAMRIKAKDFANERELAGAKMMVPGQTALLHRWVDECYRAALYAPDFTLAIPHRGRRHDDVPFMRGGIWGREQALGPHTRCSSPVMLIGKHPGVEEIETQQNFVGRSSIDLVRAFRDNGVTDETFLSFYVTNLVKFNRPDGGTGELAKSWVADCLPLLYLELMFMRPQFVLCLGADSVKALLGKGHNVANMSGRMLPLPYRAAPRDRPVRSFADLEPAEAVVMCVPHPAYVARKPAAYEDLKLGVGQFMDLVGGRIEVSDVEGDIRHLPLYTEEQLAHVVDRIRARPGDLTIAFDAEWQGRNWADDDAYVRTVQFSPRWKEAYCVVLADAGGAPVFRGGVEGAARQLRRLVADKPDGVVRVGGHAFRADMPWLMSLGLDLRPFFDVPPDWDPAVMPRGFDTLYLAHAVFEESETFKLENLAMRHTTCPRWDVKLQAWKDQYCKDNNLKDRDLEGYGECPADVLIPYGLYDADATRRLVDIFWARCLGDPGRRDAAGLDSRPGYLNSMRAWLGFLEMELTGVTVDVARTEDLIRLYAEKTEQLKAHLVKVLDWPAFNARSVPMCRELLFGVELNGTRDKFTGAPRRLRPIGCDAATLQTPEGIRTYPIPLGLTPIKTGGKPPRPWDQVVRNGETHKYDPSTDKETLGILAQENPIARILRDVRFIGQVSNTVLRPPRPAGKAKSPGKAAAAEFDRKLAQFDATHAGGRSGRAIELDGPAEPVATAEETDEQESVYDGGFIYYMDKDGRVRTHFYAAETGRCTSSRPNLQNLAKQRDSGDYMPILGYINPETGLPVGRYLDVFGGPAYLHPMRSICRAAPGCVLIEWDLQSAEIAMLAWEADDAVMIDDVRRAMLPKDHPDHIDLHAATAVAAFGLNCPPTKAGLESIGMEYIRTPAKNVRFGVPYGRSPAAIVRQCREQGAVVSLADSEALVDGWHARYRAGSRFLSRCAGRPHSPGWMSGPNLRHRRFQETSNTEVMAEQERQAKNFCIQNGVADAISLAIYNLVRYRDANPSEGTFRLVLQIHDALLVEVPIAHVPWVYDHVLPLCVCEQVSVTPRDLDGGDTILNGRPPYHFGIDRSVYINWGEELTRGPERDYVIGHGLDPKYLPKPKPSKAA